MDDLVGKLAFMLQWLLYSECRSESVWSVALQCFMFMLCKDGQAVQQYLQLVDPQIIVGLLQYATSSPHVESLLIEILTKLLYGN